MSPWLLVVGSLGCIDPDRNDGPKRNRDPSNDSPVDSAADSPEDSDSRRESTDSESGGAGPRTISVCGDGSGEYETIRDGAAAARAGDTLELCPGVFQFGAVDLDGVSLVGRDGSSATELQPIGDSSTSMKIDLSASPVTIRGLTFNGPGDDWDAMASPALVAVYGPEALRLEDIVVHDISSTRTSRLFEFIQVDRLDIDGLTVERMVATQALPSTDLSLVALNAASGEIRHVVLATNVIDGGYLWSSNLPCIDCIFANNRTNGVDGLFSYAVSGFSEPDQNVVYYGNDDPYEPPPIASAADSIFMGNRFAGVFEADAADAVNSLFYDNDFTDYDQPVIGAGDIEGDPLFTDPDNLDFTLQPGSPAIDAGNADPAYDDVDGTRNDMGAFGGPDGDWVPTL